MRSLLLQIGIVVIAVFGCSGDMADTSADIHVDSGLSFDTASESDLPSVDDGVDDIAVVDSTAGVDVPDVAVDRVDVLDANQGEDADVMRAIPDVDEFDVESILDAHDTGVPDGIFHDSGPADGETMDSSAADTADTGDTVDSADVMEVPCPDGCDDGDECTLDVCHPDTGECVHPWDDFNCPPTNVCIDANCEDGLACTANFCNDDTGGCEAVPITCANPEGPCFVTECVEWLAKCVTEPVDCDDGQECTEDSCDTETGVCSSEGPDCDDGDPCTDDWCWLADDGPSCVHQPADCADSGPYSECTLDFCHPEVGCLNVWQTGPNCGPCLFGSCDDENGCTDDSCNAETGLCEYVQKECDDGVPCTIDQCFSLSDNSSSCQSLPKSCNDANPCTLDNCDVDTGACVLVPIPDCEEPT